MAEPTRGGDWTTVSPRPRATAGLVNRRGATFEPVRIVLQEQRAAVHALVGKHHGRDPGRRAGRPLSLADRARLVELAIRVMTQAVLAAEAECRRIVSAAEAQASTIIREARDDVDRLAAWLEAGVADLDLPPMEEHHPVPEEAAVAPSRAGRPQPGPQPAGPPPGGPPPSPPPTDPPADPPDAAELGEEFFASFRSPDEDAWSFMEDDNLVGVGPAILRRVRRRMDPRS